MPNAISRETQAAIAACVHSVEELEVLLFLGRNAARYCSAVLMMILKGRGLGRARAERRKGM